MARRALPGGSGCCTEETCVLQALHVQRDRLLVDEHFNRAAITPQDDWYPRIRGDAVETNTYGLGDGAAKRLGLGLTTSGVLRGIDGERAHGCHESRVVREVDMHLEAGAVHTDIRLNRRSALRWSASICPRSASTLSNCRSSRSR